MTEITELLDRIDAREQENNIDRDEIRRLLDDEAPEIVIGDLDSFFYVAVPVTNSAVLLRWTPFEGFFNIEYGDKYQYSVEKSTKHMVDGSLGEYRVGGLTSGTWNFRSADVENIEEPTLQPIKYVGYWNHDMFDDHGKQVSKHVTIAKTMSVDAVPLIADQGLPIVAFIGMPAKYEDPDEWRKRLRNKKPILDRFKDQIHAVMLFDEPYKNNIGWDTVQEWCTIAAEELPEYKRWITMKRISHEAGRPVPDGVDGVSINFYPDRDDNSGQLSDEQYKQWLRDVIDKVRENYDGELFLVPQGFYGEDVGEKYDVPRPNAPQLVQQVSNEYGINCHLYFLGADKDGLIGSENIPDFPEAIYRTTVRN